MTKLDKITKEIEKATSRIEDEQIVKGLMVAMMICRRQLIETNDYSIQDIMRKILISIEKIERGTFDYPSFIEKETKL